jgi:hypothetical protein
MGSERYIAVGVLTPGDLDVLGTRCRRAFPLKNTDDFTSLLVRIDDAERRQSCTASDQAAHLSILPAIQ